MRDRSALSGTLTLMGSTTTAKAAIGVVAEQEEQKVEKPLPA
jgi:hypothetical protein